MIVMEKRRWVQRKSFRRFLGVGEFGPQNKRHGLEILRPANH